MKSLITFETFSKLDLRLGTIVKVNDFPEARKPAYKIVIDFGMLGQKKSTAQITASYNKNSLLGKQIIAVVNFNPKQVANTISECLILGFETEKGVVLLQPESTAANGMPVK